MISSVIAARLEYNCGHAPLVSLPRLKGETAAQRAERVARAKTEARGRACDFCGPQEHAVLEVRPFAEAAPSGQLNGHHRAGDEKENLMESVETPSVTRLGTEETRRTFPPRRRLDEAQEREVTRLYAETRLSVPEISKQVSIGESSVYRIAQRNGAGLRGRGPSGSTSDVPTALAPARARRRRRTTTTTARVAPVIASVADAAVPVAPTRRRRRRAAVAAPAPAAATAKTARGGRRPTAGTSRWEIQFRAETVIQAANISAALRQVESSLGATDVLSIVRQER
jgi:hypothetical protein